MHKLENPRLDQLVHSPLFEDWTQLVDACVDRPSGAEGLITGRQTVLSFEELANGAAG